MSFGAETSDPVSASTLGIVPVIFHIIEERHWMAAQAEGELRRSTRNKTLEEEGFIHCSDAHQVSRVANAVFRDADEPLVVLSVDTDRLPSDVHHENLEGGVEPFPHVYGPIPTDAVTSVDHLERDATGLFFFGAGGQATPRTRDGLLELERARWRELTRLLDAVPTSRAEEPSLTPEGWSVRDAVWHLACWNDVITTQLDAMQRGTFDEGFDWNTEENNARFLDTGRSVPFADAVAVLERSRREVIRAMNQLQEVTPRAIELFSEAAYDHVDDHLPELRRFFESGLRS
jgi:uncharacterized protein (DUF952 family)